MRLNARITEQQAAQLEALRTMAGQSVSEVVRAALGLYYQTLCPTGGSARLALLESGFIGCGEGPQELSETYKEELLAGIESKHGDR